MKGKKQNTSWSDLASLNLVLANSRKREERIYYLQEFFHDLAEHEIEVSLSLLKGKPMTGVCTREHLKMICYDASQLPLWLFSEAMEEGKDLLDCLAHILPDSMDIPNLRITDLHEGINRLKHISTDEQDQWIIQCWKEMNADSRYLLNKLLVSSPPFKLEDHELAAALAEAKGLDYVTLIKRLASVDGDKGKLISKLQEPATEYGSQPLPFEEWSIFNDDEFPGISTPMLGEMVYSGIRAQLIVRKGLVNIWTESGELLDQKLPDITEDALLLDQDMILEGYILAFNGQPLAIEVLLKRLKRKRYTPALARQLPVVFMASGLRTVDDVAIDHFEGRRLLETLLSRVQGQTKILLSEQTLLKSMDDQRAYHAQLQGARAEAVLLRPASVSSGDIPMLWKAPLKRLKLVLLYVDPANWGGREPSLSFGIRHGEDLLPFVKTANGLDDADWEELLLWARENTVERFGPVRSVPAEQVFEIGFKRIFEAKRKKCGLDVAGAVILRWLKDTAVSESNTLDDALELL